MTLKTHQPVWVVDFRTGEASYHKSITEAASAYGVTPTTISRSAHYRRRFKERDYMATFSRIDARNALRHSPQVLPKRQRRIKSITTIAPGTDRRHKGNFTFTKTKAVAAFLRIKPHSLSTAISLIPSQSLLSYPVPKKSNWRFHVEFHEIPDVNH